MQVFRAESLVQKIRRMELDQCRPNSEDEGNQYEVCELMTDSGIVGDLPQDSIDDSMDDSNIPSIIKNLEEGESKPITRISQILTSFSCTLYQEELKTMRTLGIIPEQGTENQSYRYINNDSPKWQNSISTKQNTTASENTVFNHLEQSLELVQHSLITDTSMTLCLKRGTNPEKCLSLFRNYLMRNKLQITHDSLDMVITKLKHKPTHLSAFLENMVSTPEVNLSLNYIQVLNCLKLVLGGVDKGSEKLSRYQDDLRRHGKGFKKYLWENNCLEATAQETVQFAFMKQSESVAVLKEVTKSILRQNNNETGLQRCMTKCLQLRQILMYQLEQRQVVFKGSSPLIEVQRKLLSQIGLYGIYKQFYSKSQERYTLRRQQIQQKYSLSSLYGHLGVFEDQRIQVEDGNFPFDSALEELEKFLSEPFPHLNLTHISTFYNSFQLSKQATQGIGAPQKDSGRLSLVIICLVKSETTQCYHKLKFLQHYLRVTDNTHFQQMCLNLTLGLDYIENAWQID